MSPRRFVLASILAAGAGNSACTEIPVAPSDRMAAGGPSYNMQGAAGPVVMTRNLYLGANLDPVLLAPAAQIPFVAAEVWAQIQATNFPARAGALADEIARSRPDVVGLQEVILYTIQSPGDAAFGGTTPATTVAFDFLQLLLDSLTARGLSYSAAAQTTTTSIEVPVYTGQLPIPFDDVRYTDRDVILVRSGIATANPQGDVYTARVSAQIGGVGDAIDLPRGWTSVDVTMDGRTFRFVNTHLEVQSFEPVQTAQAAELIGLFAGSELPVTMVGDFNSAADGSQTPAYSMILAAGYADAWSPRGDAGYTCCHANDLSNRLPELDQRLDIVFLRGFGPAPQVGARTHIVGNRPGDRNRAGIWPSDHAGVVAALRLPPAHAN